MQEDHPNPAPWDGLFDESGPIPAFGPARTDEKGRLIMDEAESLARREAGLRALKVIPTMVDETDTDEVWDEVFASMRKRRGDS